MTRTFDSLLKRFSQSPGELEVDLSLSDIIHQFVSSYSSFMRLSVNLPDEQMLYDSWLNDQTFRHDTTFPTIADFLEFAKEKDVEVRALLSAIFYLNGYSY